MGLPEQHCERLPTFPMASKGRQCFGRSLAESAVTCEAVPVNVLVGPQKLPLEEKFKKGHVHDGCKFGEALMTD